jgi:ankyrin repeat protein
MHRRIKLLPLFIFLNTALYSMDIPDLGQELRDAVKYNNTERALALIAAGAPINLEPLKPTSFGAFGEDDLKISALQWAAINGNQIVVRALIQAGASLFIDKIPKDARLHLLNGSEAYQVYEHAKTALIYAAEYGHAECVKELLDAKAYVDDMDRQNNTALVRAVKGRHIDCARELIAANAHVNARAPLMAAAKNGDAACVHELIAAKADVNDENQDEHTPLIYAAGSGNVFCVRELIAAKARVNYVTNNNYTALMHAARCGHKGTAEELIAADARLRWRGVKRVNSLGNLEEIPSLLYWSTRSNRLEMSELVVEALLAIPNQKQKSSIIAFFALLKLKGQKLECREPYRKRDFFFKDHLSKAIYEQNRNNFAESVASEEVAKLELFSKNMACPIQSSLLKKYANPSNTQKSQTICSIQ